MTPVKEPEIEIVNLIGTGNIHRELDLVTLAEDIYVHYLNRMEVPPAIYLKFSESAPTVIIAHSGKYTISGAKNKESLYNTRASVLDLFQSLDIIGVNKQDRFEIKNMVSVGDLNNTIDLNTLAIQLGLERTEYEPEQFPGLIHRPEGENITQLIFSSGKVVLTGARSENEAKESFGNLSSKIDRYIKQ